MPSVPSCVAFVASVLLATPVRPAPAAEPTCELRFEINDPRGRPLPCRVHLFDRAGKPQQAAGRPFWRDHFVCDGRAALRLPPGPYRYEIERGPEHHRLAGTVELTEGRDHTVHAVLGRLANLAAGGWYSGDLHVHRPLTDIELLMRAEDLHVAPVITWWNATDAWAGRERPKALRHRFDGNRFYHVMAGEDERGGGALLFFHLREPLAITKAAREYPPATRFVAAARARLPGVWIDVEKPFWWDVPLWVADGRVDSVGIANNHMCRSQMLANEAWGRPRDERRFPGPLGNGQWTQEIYYHLLNCGLRLPPSAGSASGVLPNPVGYNRVYVRVEGELTDEAWWAGLKAGRSFVTNGPLLLARAAGELPGHVFRGEPGRRLEIPLDLTLTSPDRVPKLEVVKDGRVDQVIDLTDDLTQQRTAKVTFDRSGWFLVRAVADNPTTFRFASTAPFHVEVGGPARRVSRRSAEFFREWVEERIARLEKVPLPDDQRREVREAHENARRFWQKLAESANAE